MIHTSKYITCISLLGFMALTGCSEDEELNLTSYPDNSSSIVITDVEEKASQVILKAKYDENGQLQLNGEIPQMYSFRLHTPSIEEANVQFETFTTNMPAELLTLDKQTAKIPVGYTDANLTATFDKEKWLELATPERSAQVYEMGVKASIHGYKMNNAASMAKVIIRKEAYLATCYLANEETNYTFAFNYSQITDDTKVKIENITVELDRPAEKDITVNVKTEGISAQFLEDIVINGGEPVIIPKGSKSVTFDWELGPEFMKDKGEVAEIFDLTLLVEIETEDETVVLDNTRNKLTAKINKMVKNLEQPSEPIPGDWTKLNKSGWTIEDIDSDIYRSSYPSNITVRGQNALVDNNEYWNAIEIYVAAPKFVPRSNVLFIVNMQKEQTLSGIRIKYNGQDPDNFYKEATISISNNKSTWTKAGTIKDVEIKNGAADFTFLAPVQAQYIKIELDDPKKTGNINLTEVTMFNK